MSGDATRLAAEMQGLSLNSKLSCANSTRCHRPSTLACSECYLVAYCSKDCQNAHWCTHHGDCNCLWSEDWISLWEDAREISEFRRARGSAPRLSTYWGNTPAFDMVRLRDNEGEGFQGPLNLLFAASGDMRSAILSVVNLPQSYRGSVNIVLNDNNIGIVARNVIFLLIFFLEENPIQAAEHVLHIWYSSAITEECHSVLLRKVKPMIEEVCDGISRKLDSTIHGKTWSFGDVNLRVVLTRDNWFHLLSHFDVPEGMTTTIVGRLRSGATETLEMTDDIEMAMRLQSPSGRLGSEKFREDGMLLPFSQPREAFTIPNPTLFDLKAKWAVDNRTLPPSEWLPESYMKVDIGPARNDIYGKLYHFLRQLFADFHQRLRSLPISFELFHTDACLLRNYVGKMRFDRIDANNIFDDRSFLDIGETLDALGLLLRRANVNQHATLVAVFKGAVFATSDRMGWTTQPKTFHQGMDEAAKKRLLEYMHKRPDRLTRSISAIARLSDLDEVFDQ